MSVVRGGKLKESCGLFLFLFDNNIAAYSVPIVQLSHRAAENNE